MKKTGVCPKCSSSDIIRDAMVLDIGEGGAERELCVATEKNPAALFFKGRKRTSVSAWVCSQCGFTELYADAVSAIAGRDG